MRELSSNMAIDGAQDVIRAFTKLNFVVSLNPIAKLTNDITSTHQISCLPKFTRKQQTLLAVQALENLGFRTAGIIVDTVSTDPLKRHSISAVSDYGISIKYRIDLGLLEIVMGQ